MINQLSFERVAHVVQPCSFESIR